MHVRFMQEHVCATLCALQSSERMRATHCTQMFKAVVSMKGMRHPSHAAAACQPCELLTVLDSLRPAQETCGCLHISNCFHFFKKIKNQIKAICNVKVTSVFTPTGISKATFHQKVTYPTQSMAWSKSWVWWVRAWAVSMNWHFGKKLSSRIALASVFSTRRVVTSSTLLPVCII